MFFRFECCATGDARLILVHRTRWYRVHHHVHCRRERLPCRGRAHSEAATSDRCRSSCGAAIQFLKRRTAHHPPTATHQQLSVSSADDTPTYTTYIIFHTESPLIILWTVIWLFNYHLQAQPQLLYHLHIVRRIVVCKSVIFVVFTFLFCTKRAYGRRSDAWCVCEIAETVSTTTTTVDIIAAFWRTHWNMYVCNMCFVCGHLVMSRRRVAVCSIRTYRLL